MGLRHWLLKTEPESYSWESLLAQGTGRWDGVRNPRARNSLKAMRKGDLAFFYHTGKEKRIVGIATVVGEAYPDPTDDTGRFVAVDITAVRPFVRPVTLAEVKASPEFAEMTLVRAARLSVQSVTPEQWTRICAMGQTEPELLLPPKAG